ncbi:formate/nitrite transporter family protein [Sulfitobacter pseudonitzschiae]|uniref:Formate/nitrite transporter family protein n=1 Tax=Pseudosulfitobacter pseudonitzschiae TaxID=1402135 RepID=A0A9Q2NI37_9RHOB|nr:formate/nitrite transporter family protein [Pseudosulfitobacter pseudonitzschiae]MBM2290651.1 formate/nitrite transporter family protein [Pseudosulfitobacter pseudonitzschiae]MBM2295569.1 formate/nitrite transporter family protein [Pseudosulfitobacter pseudonitzschiae]MBM2300481.1 formate/nitrite transporter family protein [Pseudosulfitobacter pseudonitzschiae]MBM2310266.1 formate/nitrite transporter family protein [Pseudosulfitobacter pseudonitzschiae]MBM2315178.1 formate/nitrite transport
MVSIHENDPGAVPLDEETERESVEAAAKLSSKLIYEVIRRDGEEELARTKRSLFWSGTAAGIMISFSVLGEAILRTYLPDAPWSFLIENFGYSLGFLLVIMGRMQLFTENTITTVLPLMVKPTAHNFACVARLWVIVLGANVLGAFCIATLYAYTPAIPENLAPALLSLSEHAIHMPADESFFRAIPAGILVAAIVWMLPQADESGFFIILTFTWLIAAGDFTHIVAGSVEMAYLAVQGLLGPTEALFGFFIPVLAGNIVGGTVVFALIAWGQVKDDVLAAEPR